MKGLKKRLGLTGLLLSLVLLAFLSVGLAACEKPADSSDTGSVSSSSPSSSGADSSGGDSSGTETPEVTVRFDAAGGKILNGPDEISVEEGGTISLPVPEREDYIFAGWFDGTGVNAAQVTNGTPITHSLTLTAHWTADFSEGLEYALNSDKKSYTCIGAGTFAGAALKIPTFYEGMPVTSVADGAFTGNLLLAEAELPRLLTSIGGGSGNKGAFEDCEKLKTVKFHEESSLQAVGNRAFRDCAALTLSALPDTVGTVGDYAFYGCTALTEPLLPSALETLGDYAFYGCNQFEEVSVPDGTVLVGNYAFAACTAVERVYLPDSVTTIGVNAFGNCENLVEARLPQDLEKISNELFWGCGKLAEISIPASVTVIGYDAFRGCAALTEVIIPDNVTAVYGNAFSGCIGLRDIFIPASVQKTGNPVFDTSIFIYCAADAKLSGWGERWQGYSARVIYSCTGERGQTQDGFRWAERNDGTMILVGGPSGQAAVEIPAQINGKNVSTLADSAFQNYSSLTSIVIPDTVERIGENVFYGCSSLQSMTLPFLGNDRDGTTASDVGYLFRSATFIPAQLRTVCVTDARTVGANAFYGCSGLRTVSLNDGIESIGNSAFAERGYLSSFSLPEGLVTIGEKAFYNCQNLPTLTFPDTLKSIGNNAFYHCRAMTRLELPDALESIGKEAFGLCVGLTDISLGNGEKAMGSGAFMSCVALINLDLGEGQINIPSQAFYDCQALRSVTVPGNVRAIGNLAFDYCISLESVTVLSGVQTIGEKAFTRCSRLTSIVLPETLTSVGPNAFYICQKLESIYYGGTAAGWTAIDGSGNDVADLVYVYSETEPPLNADGTAYDGRYWRYENGLPAPWVKQEG